MICRPFEFMYRLLFIVIIVSIVTVPCGRLSSALAPSPIGHVQLDNSSQVLSSPDLPRETPMKVASRRFLYSHHVSVAVRAVS